MADKAGRVGTELMGLKGIVHSGSSVRAVGMEVMGEMEAMAQMVSQESVVIEVAM